MPNANAAPGVGGPSLPVSADEGFTLFRQISSYVRQQCATYQTQVASGNVSLMAISNMNAAFYAYEQQLVSIGAVPNIVSYALIILGGGADVAGMFANLQTALTAVVNWIVANWPASNQVTASSQGQTTWNTVTAAQVAALTALITALQATVN